MATDTDELNAALAELQAMLDDTPPEMRAMLEQQMTSIRDTLRLLGRVTPVAREPLALTDDEKRFFAPRPPAALPVWIPDDLRRDTLTPTMLRCPSESTIYETEHSVGCAISTDGHGIPSPHGLTVGFHSGGNLAYQRYYDHGLLRWAIEYYLTGGRETEGNYCNREPKVHLEDGLQTRWSPGGIIIAQRTYVDGVQEGWTTLWEDDGTPIVASMYHNGQMDYDVKPGYVDVGR